MHIRSTHTTFAANLSHKRARVIIMDNAAGPRADPWPKEKTYSTLSSTRKSGKFVVSMLEENARSGHACYIRLASLRCVVFDIIFAWAGWVRILT